MGKNVRRQDRAKIRKNTMSVLFKIGSFLSYQNLYSKDKTSQRTVSTHNYLTWQRREQRSSNNNVKGRWLKTRHKNRVEKGIINSRKYKRIRARGIQRTVLTIELVRWVAGAAIGHAIAPQLWGNAQTWFLARKVGAFGIARYFCPYCPESLGACWFIGGHETRTED